MDKSDRMTAANVSLLEEPIDSEMHQMEGKTHNEAEKSANSNISRFPNVECVLDDIDALLKGRVRVA